MSKKIGIIEKKIFGFVRIFGVKKCDKTKFEIFLEHWKKIRKTKSLKKKILKTVLENVYSIIFQNFI